MVSCFLTPTIESTYTFSSVLGREIEQVVGEYILDVRDFRTDDKDYLLRQVYEMTDRRFALAEHLLRSKPWELFVMVEMGVDRMYHGFRGLPVRRYGRTGADRGRFPRSRPSADGPGGDPLPGAGSEHDRVGRGPRVALRRLLRSGNGDQPGSGCGDGRADPQASFPDRRGRWWHLVLHSHRRRGGGDAVAIERGRPGLYNIVDDEPAPVREWLPALASALGAKPPRRIPRWLGRLAGGEMATLMMTEARGASNEKAKRELGWRLRYPSWRQGFAQGLG